LKNVFTIIVLRDIAANILDQRALIWIKWMQRPMPTIGPMCTTLVNTGSRSRLFGRFTNVVDHVTEQWQYLRQYF